MWGLIGGSACFAVPILAVIGVARILVPSSPLKIETSRDVFGFAGRDTGAADGERSAIERYLARDGPQLTHRFYDSAGERLLVFAHGSSYHGGYHALAWAISRSGTTKVVLPICADIICLGGVAAMSILSGNSRTISSTSSVSFNRASGQGSSV